MASREGMVSVRGGGGGDGVRGERGMRSHVSDARSQTGSVSSVGLPPRTRHNEFIQLLFILTIIPSAVVVGWIVIPTKVRGSWALLSLGTAMTFWASTAFATVAKPIYVVVLSIACGLLVGSFEFSFTRHFEYEPWHLIFVTFVMIVLVYGSYFVFYTVFREDQDAAASLTPGSKGSKVAPTSTAEGSSVVGSSRSLRSMTSMVSFRADVPKESPRDRKAHPAAVLESKRTGSQAGPETKSILKGRSSPRAAKPPITFLVAAHSARRVAFLKSKAYKRFERRTKGKMIQLSPVISGSLLLVQLMFSGVFERLFLMIEAPIGRILLCSVYPLIVGTLSRTSKRLGFDWAGSYIMFSSTLLAALPYRVLFFNFTDTFVAVGVVIVAALYKVVFFLLVPNPFVARFLRMLVYKLRIRAMACGLLPPKTVPEPTDVVISRAMRTIHKATTSRFMLLQIVDMWMALVMIGILVLARNLGSMFTIKRVDDLSESEFGNMIIWLSITIAVDGIISFVFPLLRSKMFGVHPRASYIRLVDELHLVRYRLIAPAITAPMLVIVMLRSDGYYGGGV